MTDNKDEQNFDKVSETETMALWNALDANLTSTHPAGLPPQEGLTEEENRVTALMAGFMMQAAVAAATVYPTLHFNHFRDAAQRAVHAIASMAD